MRLWRYKTTKLLIEGENMPKLTLSDQKTIRDYIANQAVELQATYLEAISKGGNKVPSNIKALFDQVAEFDVQITQLQEQKNRVVKKLQKAGYMDSSYRAVKTVHAPSSKRIWAALQKSMPERNCSCALHDAWRNRYGLDLQIADPDAVPDLLLTAVKLGQLHSFLNNDVPLALMTGSDAQDVVASLKAQLATFA
jgi:hypothetical protein